MGGAYNYGTLFSITLKNAQTTRYSFCPQSGCADGDMPRTPLVQAPNGDFYGTTFDGGLNKAGTFFRISQAGTLATLYSFCSRACTDGDGPVGLVRAANGNFYGTTASGGANGYFGTIFQITPGGTLTTLYSFCSQGGANCTDGISPYARLVQATNGDFYGTTEGGGVNQNCFSGCGTVFRYSVGLRPFVETLPPSGKVGAAVRMVNGRAGRPRKIDREETGLVVEQPSVLGSGTVLVCPYWF